jgi:uncharacterized membrane-anchored protein YhcB (DUF1043 family)
MEIHAPEHPIMTWKQFLVHIGTVTIGILIALSLEALLETTHKRHLVTEARENIRTELEDNARELAGHLTESAKLRDQQLTVLHWIADVERTGKSSIQSLAIGASRADLSNTSWLTAQTVGALALMNYAEVKHYAAVYQLQDEFLRLQSRAQDTAVDAMIIFNNAGSNPDKLPHATLEEEKSRVATSLTALTVNDQIAVELQKRYTATLHHK